MTKKREEKTEKGEEKEEEEEEEEEANPHLSSLPACTSPRGEVLRL